MVNPMAYRNCFKWIVGVAVISLLWPGMTVQVQELDFNYANTYVMVVRIQDPPRPNPPNAENERYVYEVHNPSFRLIPRLSDPNSFSITVDREENLYIADKVDYSTIPSVITQPADDPRFRDGLALEACRRFTRQVIMESYVANIPPDALPDGLNPNIVYWPTYHQNKYPTEGNEIYPGGDVQFCWFDPTQATDNPSGGLGIFYPILFFRPVTVDGDNAHTWEPGLDRLGCWHGSINHNYGYHVNHAINNQDAMAKLDLDRDGEFGADEEFESLVCYPHSYVMTSEGDGGAEGGCLAEPWGQTIELDMWLPNGTWHHRNHRIGGVDDSVRVLRSAFQLTNVFGHLYGWDKGDSYSDDTLMQHLALWIVKDLKWSLRQCGDPCASGEQGQLGAPMAYTKNPFQLMVGPSNRMYLFSPYDDNNVLRYKDPIYDSETGDISYPADWEPFDIRPIMSTPELASVVNVDCNYDEANERWTNLKYIGLATYSIEQDWVYLSSADEFTVGDQFDGKGGVMYYRTGTEIRQIDEDCTNSTLTTLGAEPWGPDSEVVELAGGIEINEDTNLSADGLGNLYFITANTGDWRITDWSGEWGASAIPLLQEQRGEMTRTLDLKLWIYPRRGEGFYNPPGTDYNNETQVVEGVAYRDDPNDDIPVPDVPDPRPLAETEFSKSLHVDLATVNDASPPIEGKCIADITPVNTTPGKFEHYGPWTDVILIEDFGERAPADAAPPFVARWQFENTANDYTVSDSSDWVNHECVLPYVEDIGGTPPPYRSPNWNWNPLHYNFMNQRRYEKNNIDPNTNGVTGGWSSNILGDTLTTPGTPTAKAHDTREYQWSVWLIATEGENLPAPVQIYPDPLNEAELPNHEAFFVPHTLDGSEAHPEHHQNGGYEFSYVFKDAGVYEVRLEARCHVYDYRMAGVMPRFILNPDEYIDLNGGQEADRAYIIATGNQFEMDPTTEFVRYYCKAPAQFKENYVGPESSYPIIARRRVIVGAKIPDYGAWAALQLFARKEERPGVPVNDTAWKTSAHDSDVPGFIELDEEQQLEMQAVAATKYFKDVDEKTIRDYIEGKTDPISGQVLDANDLRSEVHDQFSGVVPGSVTYRWSYYNGSEVFTVDTLETEGETAPDSTEDKKAPNLVMARKWSTNSVITPADCPGLEPGMEFAFDTKDIGGLCGGGFIDEMKNIFEPDDDPQIDLRFHEEAPGAARSTGRYVPDFSDIALFFHNPLHTNPPFGTVPPYPPSTEPEYLPGQGMKQLYWYPTPSFGRPENCYETITGMAGYGNAMNSYRIKVELFADVKEFKVTAGVEDELTKVVNAAVVGWPEGSAGAAKMIAQMFTPTLHPGIKLCDKIFDVRVDDITAPVVALSTENAEIGATSGDLFSNDITLTIMDNNPYTAPGAHEESPAGMNGLLWDDDKKLSARLLYTIVPNGTEVDQGEAAPADLIWGDLPSETEESSWCNIVARLMDDLRPGLVKTEDYDSMMHSPVSVTYVFSADQWRMNADGGCPPGDEPEPAADGSRAGNIVLYATAVDASGNGLMVETGGNQYENVPALLNESSAATQGEGQTNYGPDYVHANNVGDLGVNTSKAAADADCQGNSYISTTINIRDNDPPEICFTIEDVYGETVFVIADDHQIFQVARVQDSGGALVEKERINPAESNSKEKWETWPRSLGDVTTAAGEVAEHSIAPSMPGSIGQFAMACLIKGAVGGYYWRFPLDGIPLTENDERFIWDLYYQNDEEPITPGSLVTHANWFVDFRFSEVNEGIVIVAPPNDYVVDNVLNYSSNEAVKFFGLPEDTRITFRLKAEDNVDGPFQEFVPEGPGKNYDINLSGADELFNVDNWDTLHLYQEDSAAEMKEYSFYQVYHHPSPEGDEAIKILSLKVWDRAGNARSIKIPLKVINTNVRVYSLENLKNYPRPDATPPTN